MVDSGEIFAPRAWILASMLEACYWNAMANLQVKNVPDELHERLRQQARRQGRTVRDLVLEAVRKELSREEFRERLAQRAPVELGRPAARSLEEGRNERDRELGT